MTPQPNLPISPEDDAQPLLSEAAVLIREANRAWAWGAAKGSWYERADQWFRRQGLALEEPKSNP